MRLREARESAPGKRRGVELDQGVAQRTQELAATVDSIPGLIGVLSADGQVVEFVNRQLLEFCGRTLEDFRSTDVVHPDDLENSTLAGRHGFETGQSYSVDHRLRRADGAYRWFHAVGQPLRDASGHVIRWHLLLTDIHERKIAEEKLAQQTEELAALVDSIPGMVGVLTVEGEVEFVNRPLREYAGKTLEEFKDWTTNDTVHPDDLANTIAAWRRAVETGQPHTYDHRVRRRCLSMVPRGKHAFARRRRSYHPLVHPDDRYSRAQKSRAGSGPSEHSPRTPSEAYQSDHVKS